MALFLLETGSIAYQSITTTHSMFIFRKENGLDADYVKIVKNSSQQNDWTFKAVDAYQVTSRVIGFKTIEA